MYAITFTDFKVVAEFDLRLIYMKIIVNKEHDFQSLSPTHSFTKFQRYGQFVWLAEENAFPRVLKMHFHVYCVVNKS